MRAMFNPGSRSVRKVQLLVTGLLVGLLPFGSALADADGERALLARISHELVAIGSLIEKARSQADTDTRIKFNYNWLRQDLNQVRVGIEAHIDAPRPERFHRYVAIIAGDGGP